MLTDTLYVMEVISGGPSQKVGLMPGDKIIYVNDSLIAGIKMNNQDVIKKLRGPKGTTVDVKVLRRGTPQLLEFRIVRDKIPIYSIDASYMVDKQTGYIRLSRFGINSSEEFLEAGKALKAQGMKNLILDLTGNGGGILQTASDIADQFLGAGKLVVYTEGRNQPRQELGQHRRAALKMGGWLSGGRRICLGKRNCTELCRIGTGASWLGAGPSEKGLYSVNCLFPTGQ